MLTHGIAVLYPISLFPAPATVTNISSTSMSCNPSTTPRPNIIPDDTGGGVLGIYRITLWIIVLTLTIFSTAMTSFTLDFII